MKSKSNEETWAQRAHLHTTYYIHYSKSFASAMYPFGQVGGVYNIIYIYKRATKYYNRFDGLSLQHCCLDVFMFFGIVWNCLELLEIVEVCEPRMCIILKDYHAYVKSMRWSSQFRRKNRKFKSRGNISFCSFAD